MNVQRTYLDVLKIAKTPLADSNVPVTMDISFGKT
jgi:hypothetical protein